MRRFRGHKRPHEALVAVHSVWTQCASSALFCCCCCCCGCWCSWCSLLPFACLDINLHWASTVATAAATATATATTALTLCASRALDCCLSWPLVSFAFTTLRHSHTRIHIHPIGSGVGSWFIPLRIINAHILIIAGLGSQTSASAVGVLFFGFFFLLSLLFDLNLF